MDFSNVVVIVTGASRGIGKMVANILKKYNAKVIGVEHNEKIDLDIDKFKCDITKEDDVKDLFNYVIKKYRYIDVIINCAAINKDNKYIDKTYNEFMDVLSVNLGGTYLMNKYGLLNIDKGVIINLSSLDGIDTYNEFSIDYCASKAGINNLTKNMATINKNIKVCALAPAWVDTESVLEMNPSFLKKEMEKNNQKRLLKKEEVALKIIDMIINNDDYISGDIVKMEVNNE